MFDIQCNEICMCISHNNIGAKIAAIETHWNIEGDRIGKWKSKRQIIKIKASMYNTCDLNEIDI